VTLVEQRPAWPFFRRSPGRVRPWRKPPSQAETIPANLLEARLLQHLLKRFQHVSMERVCSGIGLMNIYNFLKEHEHVEEPNWLAEQLRTVRDPVPVIVSAALDEKRLCRLCQATLNRFISILGAEAGNLCLGIMATGGIYLGGGIPPRIVPALENGLFMEAFRNKGRMSGLMDTFPVHVALNPDAALMGAACYGLRDGGNTLAGRSDDAS